MAKRSLIGGFGRPEMLFLAALTASALTLPSFAEPVSISFESFDNLETDDNSALRFTGGLVLRSSDADFGGLSGLQVVDAGSRLIAVSDEASFFVGEIERDGFGKVTGVADVRKHCLCRRDGKPYRSKRWSDAEGLFVEGSTAYVSFERLHRVNRYDLDANSRPGPPRPTFGSLESLDLTENKGIEALFRVGSQARSETFIAFAEDSRDRDGNHRGFIISDDSITEFSVFETDGFSITGADTTSDGRLILLQRRFSYLTGLKIRLLSVSLNEVAANRTLRPSLLAEFDGSQGIDNMEGLSVWKDIDGITRIGMISDDNFSNLQKTLYLEFILN